MNTRLARQTSRFEGHIAGVGSESGIRVVLGIWHTSPWGPFADAMVETAAGHRVLIAPEERVRQFVSATYHFDETRIETITAHVGSTRVSFESESLKALASIGPTTPLGHALTLVPTRLATSPGWSAVTDPIARLLLRGVRTRGSAGNGRREYYGATGARHLCDLLGSFEGVPMGALRPVDPPCRFGFSSTPKQPSITEVVTTVRSPQR